VFRDFRSRICLAKSFSDPVFARLQHFAVYAIFKQESTLIFFDDYFHAASSLSLFGLLNVRARLRGRR
ncbi:MAG: hypothetical protein FWH07_08630, partial [Oscillospiraceae bacterium]|nr:hypothetical protein [Oscillospiraceae bacterium]